jgi:hypothetical protein
MLRLPSPDLAVRELFEPSDLVDYRKLPTFRQALTNANNTIARNPAVRSVQVLTMRANGEIWLLRVGNRGGWKCLWNFGNPVI